MSDAEQLNDDAYEQENAAQEDVTPAGETGAEAPQVQETGSAQSATDLELFEKYIEEDLDFDLPNRGDMREGMIVEVRPSELLVNVGSKRDGVVPQSDLARLDPDYVKSLHEGQTVDVVVSRQPDDDGIFLLSIAEALQQRDWLLAEQLLESSEVTSHRVVGYNKGGLTVEFNHLRGFVPASHVVDMPRNLSEEQRRAELESRIGKTLRLKVIEVERRRRRLVMSQSLAEREFQAARREELFKTISVGDVIQGEVRSMRPFGAFVDIGGADGLLHVSEIDWRPVNHPRDVLEVGEMIEVEVIRVDPENQRIALSRKRRLPNPWDTVEQRYHPGEIVPVKITRVVDFGAFAQLEPGVEGLIHISELADIAVAEPLKTVQIGDEVYVKILRVDSNRQRIGLSLRQAGDLGPVTSAQDEEEAEAEADEQEDVDQEAADQEIVSQGDVDQEAGEQEAVEDESEEE
ncbi:MAG: S1 RNA-binding domain-containing protein [Chloroflexota bacterium]|jgi:small subunit ribosomal protein S1|nr:S1 RNA-binding domain-containing protein [Chloroflexota bacterium]